MLYSAEHNVILYKTEQPQQSDKEREKYIGSFSLD